MTVERKLELLVLKELLKDYNEYSEYKLYLDEYFNVSKIKDRYMELGKEFLNDYAIDKTEKSD
jgi:hypothetical protein